MTTTHLDWNATEEKARGMSDAAIHYAIVDLLKTLPHADAMDRELGGDRGGRYRDEISVLRREAARRRA